VEPLLLMIEDEKMPMRLYLRALEKVDYEVKQCAGPDSALDFAKRNADDISAILLDIMMAPGEAYKHEDTQEGLKTGIFLYRDLKELMPHVPIILLTNVTNQETLAEFPEGPLLAVAQKLDYPPLALERLVAQKIREARETPATKGKDPSSSDQERKEI